MRYSIWAKQSRVCQPYTGYITPADWIASGIFWYGPEALCPRNDGAMWASRPTYRRGEGGHLKRFRCAKVARSASLPRRGKPQGCRPYGTVGNGLDRSAFVWRRGRTQFAPTGPGMVMVRAATTPPYGARLQVKPAMTAITGNVGNGLDRSAVPEASGQKPEARCQKPKKPEPYGHAITVPAPAFPQVTIQPLASGFRPPARTPRSARRQFRSGAGRRFCRFPCRRSSATRNGSQGAGLSGWARRR